MTEKEIEKVEGTVRRLLENYKREQFEVFKMSDKNMLFGAWAVADALKIKGDFMDEARKILGLGDWG